MNKQELKQLLKDSEVKGLKIFDTEVYGIPSSTVFVLIDQLDEPEKGYAEQSLQYLKNILARLRELPLHDREVWLKAIMSEFEQDFSMERKKVKIPQFVEDYIKDAKCWDWDIQDAMKYMDDEECAELLKWFYEEKNMETFARAWLDGYEVEKEKQYRVKMLGVNEECECLVFGELSNTWKLRSLGSFGELRKHHTRKELEEAGFGWVFDCEGIEVEEVE